MHISSTSKADTNITVIGSVGGRDGVTIRNAIKSVDLCPPDREVTAAPILQCEPGIELQVQGKKFSNDLQGVRHL